MNGRVAAVSALLMLILVDVAMIVVALRRYPPVWAQPGARTYVLEPVCALAAYAAVAVWIASRRGEWWSRVLRVAVRLGSVAAVVDIFGLLVEDGLLFRVRGPAVQISVMIATFLLWGLAGWRAARTQRSVAAGAAGGVLSAFVCAILAVSAGFAIELFIAPPAPWYVKLWGEYQRSGWTDARAFGLANTLDSGFSHLVLSPVVGAVVGGIAAVIGRTFEKQIPFGNDNKSVANGASGNTHHNALE